MTVNAMIVDASSRDNASIGTVSLPVLAQMRSADCAEQCPVLRVKPKHMLVLSSSQFDAVDGAHSAASKCHRVVAIEQTTLRGAVHG